MGFQFEVVKMADGVQYFVWTEESGALLKASRLDGDGAFALISAKHVINRVRVEDQSFADITKAWSKEAREAAIAARKGAGKAGGKAGSGGGDAGMKFAEKDPRGKAEYKGTLDRHGIAASEFGSDVAGGAVGAMASQWHDAMSGAVLPKTRDKGAQDSMEKAISDAGLRPKDVDTGYAEGNLHLVDHYDEAKGTSRTMGVDSLTGKVYKGDGKLLGHLAPEKPLAPQLGALWKKVKHEAD